LNISFLLLFIIGEPSIDDSPKSIRISAYTLSHSLLQVSQYVTDESSVV